MRAGNKCSWCLLLCKGFEEDLLLAFGRAALFFCVFERVDPIENPCGIRIDSCKNIPHTVHVHHFANLCKQKDFKRFLLTLRMHIDIVTGWCFKTNWLDYE